MFRYSSERNDQVGTIDKFPRICLIRGTVKLQQLVQRKGVELDSLQRRYVLEKIRLEVSSRCKFGYEEAQTFPVTNRVDYL